MCFIEENYVTVYKTLIREVKDHMNDNMRIYGSEERYNYILNGLRPLENSSGIAPPDKWLTLSNLNHIVATYYNRVVVELTNHEIG